MPSEVAADLSAEEAARFAGIRGIQAKTAEQDCDGGRVRLTLAAGYATDGELRVVAHYHWLQAPRHQAQDAVGLAYSAALLTETGEELVSQRHLIDQGGETRQLEKRRPPPRPERRRHRHPRPARGRSDGDIWPNPSD